MEQANATLLNTPGVLGVYNFAKGDCSTFRSNASALFFKVWPEGSFRYCCEDTTYELLGKSLSNYTYGNYSARIISRPYFDLGIIDSLSPYYTQYQFWQVPQTQIILDGIMCEYTDLKGLYSHRFWTKVMRDGLLMAAYIIALIQFVVVVFVICKWCILPCLRRKPRIRENMRRWWWTKIKLEDWISDLAHIALVVVVGNCLIEAVGHSSPIRWRTIVFYNAAVVYAWLTLLCLITSVLRQLAVSAFDESEDEVKRREYLQVRLEKEYLCKDKPVPKDEMEAIQRSMRFAFSQISEDWRWQRVFGQLAVLILVATYLRFVDDDSGIAMDNMASVVLAALVVGCMWSGGVGFVVAGRTLSHIGRHLMTRRLPPVNPEDEILKQIQIEGCRNQISQTFYGPGAGHWHRHNYNQQYIDDHMNGVNPPFRAGPPGSMYR